LPRRLPHSRFGSISGTVTEEATGHAAIEDVWVCVWAESEEFEPEPGANCKLTDAQGKYTIPGLPAGQYKVEFRPGSKGLNFVAEYYDDEPSWVEADPVEVTTTAKTGIDAELAEGGQIHGKVTNEIGGAGIERVFVCAEENESPWYFECAATDAAGEYTIAGLPAGEYWIEFWPEGQNFVYEFESGVPVTLGATTQKNAALTPGAVITGQVTDAVSHVGVEGIYVCALGLSEEELFRCVETGALGLYSLERLPPGTYKAGFALFGEEEGGAEALYVPQYFNGKSTLAAADPISLGASVTQAGVGAALVKKRAAAVTVPPPLPLSTGPTSSGPGKKLHCRKGFHKRKVKGRSKCVRVRKKKHHRAGPRAHGSALHLRARQR
jgi:hypothetical protein